ncbi:MAG: META domain-containing protein [Ferruginibacter sp.]
MEIAKYSSQLPDSLSKKQTAGVDFFASGNSPANWTLDMDFDKVFNFKAVDGTVISTQAIAPSAATDAATTYTCKTVTGILTIVVYNAGCSGQEKINKKTELFLNDKHYTGCGENLYNFNLNDNWVLENAGNTVLSAADFSKGLPRLAFDLAQKKITGTDGCNNIVTSIDVQGSRIKFGEIAATKINCKNNSVQKIFGEKLSNKTASYFFREGKLYLYLIDDSLLIFRKAN